MKTANILIPFAALATVGCDTNKGIDAACQGTYQTAISRNAEKHETKESKIFSYHYDRATKVVAFNDVKFPADRTLDKDGVVTASQVPIIKLTKDGADYKETEWVEYDVKTNVLHYSHLATSMSKNKGVLVIIDRNFESICKPAK